MLGPDKVSFNVLVGDPATLGTPTVENIDAYKANPDDLEKCKNWLIKQGFEVYPTAFGLACHGTKACFESVFRAKVSEVGKLGQPPELIGELIIPQAVEKYVREITLEAEPEMF